MSGSILLMGLCRYECMIHNLKCVQNEFTSLEHSELWGYWSVSIKFYTSIKRRSRSCRRSRREVGPTMVQEMSKSVFKGEGMERGLG